MPPWCKKAGFPNQLKPDKNLKKKDRNKLGKAIRLSTETCTENSAFQV